MAVYSFMVQERFALIAGFILFSVLFFLFYPSTYAIVDEAAYVTTTYTFQHGAIFYDHVGFLHVPMDVTVSGHSLSKYPPLNSLLLLPFCSINWRLGFLRGYLLMAIGFWLVMKMLQQYRLSKLYALFFLFHPAFVLYSRTLMSDLPATIATLIGVYCFIKKRYSIAGGVLGIGVAIRYPSLLVPATLGVILAFRAEWRHLAELSMGTLIAFIPLMVYHLACFRTIFGPIGAYGMEFSPHHFLSIFKQFFIYTNVLYPFFLILPIFSRVKEKWDFILLTLVFILSYSFLGFIDRGETFFESLIRGQRFVLPVLPLLLIPYIDVVNKMRFVRKIIVPGLCILCLLAVVIHYRHQQFLQQEIYYQNLIYTHTKDADLILCNKEVYELFNPYQKYVPWAPFESRRRLLSLDTYSTFNKNMYLACIARDEEMEGLCHAALLFFSEKEEVYASEVPLYCTIWRVRNVSNK